MSALHRCREQGHDRYRAQSGLPDRSPRNKACGRGIRRGDPVCRQTKHVTVSTRRNEISYPLLSCLVETSTRVSTSVTGAATKGVSLRDLIRAGILTAVVPMAGAFTSYWLAPWSCDANAWLCVLPLALLSVAPFAALFLPVLLFVNRRRRRPLPDGWVSIFLLSGVFGQLMTSGVSLWLTAPYVRHVSVFEVLFIPQGFVAGAIVGAVFCVSLNAFSRSPHGS